MGFGAFNDEQLLRVFPGGDALPLTDEEIKSFRRASIVYLFTGHNDIPRHNS